MPESEYREPTDEEKKATNPATPYKHEKRVRVSAPNGIVYGSVIEFEDGTPVYHVLRAVIAMNAIEPPTVAMIYMTCFAPQLATHSAPKTTS
jgi:hypothetical protein